MKKLVKWIYCVCVICVLFCFGVWLADVFAVKNRSAQFDSAFREMFDVRIILSGMERTLAGVFFFFRECLVRIKSIIFDNRSFFDMEFMIE